jgi:hypothetical protein
MLIYTKETKIPKEQNLGMSVDQFVRWGCLVEAVELIEDKAVSLKVDIDKNSDWIKPVNLKKYIKERFNSLKDELINQM